MSSQILPRWTQVLFRYFMIPCALWPVSLHVTSVSAQTSGVPYDSEGPRFHMTSSSYAYPSGFGSIHDVDFENLKVTFWNDKNGRPMLNQLKNGGWEIRFRNGAYDSICLRAVHSLRSADPGRQYALAVYEEDNAGGSSSQDGIAQVFELADERLTVMEQIDWDLHYGGPYGPLDDFDEKANTFTVRSAHYQPGDGHCCVSWFDVVTYRWDGWGFNETSIQTEPSNYGRPRHKASPPKPIPLHMP